MFSIELKFIINCLKFWFQKNHQILELEIDFKMEFKQNNPLTNETLCCLCGFPMDPRAENRWANHAFKAEDLFLENIYTQKQMVAMGIDNFEHYSQKLNKILDSLNSFCADINSESSTFCHPNPQIDEIIEKIKKIKTHKDDDGKATKEKTIGLLYNHSMDFIPTDKVKGDFPISDKFLSNMIAIVKNQTVNHHSHVTGKIIGYAHDFCNQKCKENYSTIPVIAHNQFRFDFFLFLKGIRPSVWETSGISIGGKNQTDVNFAIIKNQVRFIDTVKYFQQSLGSLADSMTDTERGNVRNICRKFLADKLLFLNDENEKSILDCLASGKGMIPYQLITDFESLNIHPEKEFFSHQDFYSCLKETTLLKKNMKMLKSFFVY